MPGDVVVGFADQHIGSGKDLSRAIAMTPPGTAVPVFYQRRGQTLLIVMRLP